MTKNNTTPENPWLRQNVTGFMYHKDLTANTSYMFAVTAWNRWGESLLERGKMLAISTKFPGRITKNMDETTILIGTGKSSRNKLDQQNVPGLLTCLMGFFHTSITKPQIDRIFIIILYQIFFARAIALNTSHDVPKLGISIDIPQVIFPSFQSL